MLEVAKLSRDKLIELGLSRRVAMRVGSLLSKGVGFTLTVLEEASDNNDLQKLILSSELRSPVGNINPVISNLLDNEEFSLIKQEFPLVVVEQEDMQVIALDEEVEAEEFFGSEDGNDNGSVLNKEKPSNLPASTSKSLNKTGTDKAFGFDTSTAAVGENINQLRVKIFAGSGIEERTSALRKLVFTDIENIKKIEIILQAISDSPSELRSSCASALGKLGFSGQWTDAARLLAEGDQEERIYACQRLKNTGKESSGLECRGTVMALCGAIQDESSDEVISKVIDAMAVVAPLDADFADIIETLMRLLTDQAIAGTEAVKESVRQAYISFDKACQGLAAPFLLHEAHAAGEGKIRSFFLTIATALFIPDNIRVSFYSAIVDCLLELKAESPEAHLLGNYLSRCGDEAICLIIDKIENTDIAHKRFFCRHIDSSVRFGSLKDDTLVKISMAVLKMLRTGTPQLVNDIFETKLAVPDCLPDDVRPEMAQALCDAVRKITIPQSHYNVETLLVSLGCGVVKVLLNTCVQRIGTFESDIACKAIGRIAVEDKSNSDKSAKDFVEAMRVLQKLSFSDNKKPDGIYVALGRLCSSGIFSEQQVGMVRRSMLDRLKGNFEDAEIIEALGWISANPNEVEENLSLISGIAMTHIEGENSEATIKPEFVDGEEVFSFGGELEIDTELIPASISAIQNVVLSPVISESLRNDIIQRLIKRWKECASFKIQWSPGNVSKLTTLLGVIGSSDIVSHRQRVFIAQNLSAKIYDIIVMKAIAEIIVKDKRTPQLDKLARIICLRLLKNIEQENELTFEDRETYLKIICTLVMRGRFDENEKKSKAILARAVDEIFIGLRLAVPDLLKYAIRIRDKADIPEEIKKRVTDQLKEFTTVVKMS